jgi:hypothetical protein
MKGSEGGRDRGGRVSLERFQVQCANQRSGQSPASLHTGTKRRNAAFSARTISCRLWLAFSFGKRRRSRKGLGFGATEVEATFAKSGDLPEGTQLDFGDSGWRAVDLPNDWAYDE